MASRLYGVGARVFVHLLCESLHYEALHMNSRSCFRCFLILFELLVRYFRRAFNNVCSCLDSSLTKEHVDEDLLEYTKKSDLEYSIGKWY